ncbi:DoxX family protein [Rhodococcus sp. NPDC058521]|uniref:DoxX family protein n=1 Tax=Rhodococcus sp. NPDC058521 TaxID=3346536 RepID=UPI00364D1F10
MEPLIALILVTLAVAALGTLGIDRFKSWPVALRGGLAAMFTLTGVVHFVGMREELIAMVPPALPNPGLLVTITGILELAGAVGLLIHRTAPLAAGCLCVMLLVMFPANVFKALDGPVGFFDSLVPRTIMQVIFVGATVAVALSRRGRPSGAEQESALRPQLH